LTPRQITYKKKPCVLKVLDENAAAVEAKAMETLADLDGVPCLELRVSVTLGGQVRCHRGPPPLCLGLAILPTVLAFIMGHHAHIYVQALGGLVMSPFGRVALAEDMSPPTAAMVANVGQAASVCS
jgi:hypothetical protein